MKIIFLHPDLGLGGAERLIGDAALALRSRGHDVKIVTNQFSKNHCFKDLIPIEGCNFWAHFNLSFKLHNFYAF